MDRRNYVTPSRLAAALALFSVCLGVRAALGQEAVPRIWDVPLGTHVSDLPALEFVDPACGTRGGPPSLVLENFLDFEKCREEESGLREIWFIYDDELEHIALATRDRMMIARSRATQVLGQPVILSFLVDAKGLVQGYRIFTDPRAVESERKNAYLVAIPFKARHGRDGWECLDMPLAEGETPIGLISVKQQCQKLGDGKKIVVNRRHYYKPGQSYINPRTKIVAANEFESSSSLELIALEPAPRRTPPWVDQAAAAGAGQGPLQPLDARAAFIAGRTVNCPGCDLAGLSFKRRDLAGADLSNANLEETSFYRSILRGANLSAANLRRANLNRADLTLARLTGAKLDGAMLYLADAPRADFSGAALVETMMGRARLSLANFEGANLEFADLGAARLNDTNFVNAILDDALLDHAVLLRADMRGARAERALLIEASLRNANLAGAVLRDSDLTGADLAETDLTDADMSRTVLKLTNLRDANQTGTKFSGALMPDYSRHP